MRFKKKLAIWGVVFITALGLTGASAPAAMAANLPSNCSISVGAPYKSGSSTVKGYVSGACAGGDARLKTASAHLDYFTGSIWSNGGTTSYSSPSGTTSIAVTGSRSCVTTATWRTSGTIKDIYGDSSSKTTAGGIAC